MWQGKAEDLAQKIHGQTAHDPLDIAGCYVYWSRTFGLRTDILWAQMRLETADLRFGGAVLPIQNNFCGLRFRDGSGFYSFDTPSKGVAAHAAHMAFHVYPDHLNGCDLLDPKHGPHPNDVKVIGDLDVWSTKGYARKVLARLER